MKQLADLGDVGAAYAINDSLVMVRVMLPGHSIGHLNSYIFTSGGEHLVIDVPWVVPGIYENYLRLLRAVRIKPENITKLLLTHFHDDHSGSAVYLQRDFGVAPMLHSSEVANYNLRFLEKGRFKTILVDWLERVGADENLTAAVLEQNAGIDERMFHAQGAQPLEDGDVVHFGDVQLRVFHTPGHTEGHLCFFEPEQKILFSGDHMYKELRGNAMTRPMSSPSPIADYWRSNRKLLEYQPDHVCPGHGDTFFGFEQRFYELERVYRRKAEEILGLCEKPSTATEVASRMRRSKAWSELSSVGAITAIGEAHGYLIEGVELGTLVSLGGIPERWQRADSVAFL